LWTLVPRLAAAVTERGPSERSVRPPRPHGRATRVLVAPGVYRESVDPALAGEENARIVYRSEKPLAAVITGAETVKTWERYRDNVWVCRIDNDVFGAYNPYTTLVAGDWYFAPPVRHTGAVYLNDRQLYETENLEECVRGEIFTPSWEPEASIYKWYTEQECGRTVIYANFQGSDPNTENVEINVRRNCFLPSRTGVDYITLSGFTVTKAATTWAPPASYQDGMIGPHWAKGWIIEDCDVSNSKCCGISLGKYLDPENDQYFTHRHVKSPTQMERDAVCRGQYHGWLKEKVGSHIVRRCRIHHCEQAGIVGRMGCVFSIIEDNDIHHINNMQQLCGAEIAGIKFHAAIDVVIRRNHIHHCTMGIWCDWQAQGTRLTQNLLHDNQAPEGTPIFDYSTVNQDIFVEVSHGPTLIDNNILLSKTSIRLCAQGVACVHNLIAGTFTSVGEGTDNAVNGVNQPRYTPYHIPHRTEVAGFMSILHGDDRFYNNIFIQKWPVSDDSGKNAQGFLLPPENKIAGTAVFDDYPTYGEWIKWFEPDKPADMGRMIKYHFAHLPVWVEGNAYFDGAAACKNERGGVTDGCSRVFAELKKKDGQYTLNTNVYDCLAEIRDNIVTSDTLGRAFEPDERFENPDGTAIVFDSDYFGEHRRLPVVPGPFAACPDHERPVWPLRHDKKRQGGI
jgi:alpha-N-arabinofuranosidase